MTVKSAPLDARGIQHRRQMLKILEQAQRATAFIAQNPFAGPHPSWATRHRTLRFWVISGTRFLIFYIPEEKEISIERVLDGRRDVKRILEHAIEDPPENCE